MTRARKNSPPSATTAPSVIPADGWLSVVTAAKVLGVAPATVNAMVIRGELAHQVVGGRVWIARDSVPSTAAAPTAVRRAASSR